MTFITALCVFFFCNLCTYRFYNVIHVILIIVNDAVTMTCCACIVYYAPTLQEAYDKLLWIMHPLNIIIRRGFIIDGTPYGGISGDKDMDSDSSPLASALKKRNSPPICWSLGLNKDTFKTVKVILLGQPGVGKSGE